LVIENPSILILAVVTSTALLWLLLGLGHCFLGYVLFRIALAIDGAIAGWALGGVLVAMIRPPSETDLLVAGLACAVLLGMLAWFLFRSIFALGVGALVAWLVATSFGEAPGLGAWILGGLAGLVLAVFCYAQMRRVVVVLTAIGGAILTVAGAGAMLADLSWHPLRWLTAGHVGGIVAFAATLALAVAGIMVQRASPFFVSNRYSPQGRKRHRGDSRVKPRFTKG
jgi:hypothetical protein